MNKKKLQHYENLQHPFLCIATFALGVFTSCKTSAPSASKQAQIAAYTSKIEGQNFKFEANSATPMGHRTINLTSGYYLRVSKDTVQSYFALLWAGVHGSLWRLGWWN